MDEPDATPKLPGKLGLGDVTFNPASPLQRAKLRFLGVSFEEPISSQDANRIIDLTNNDPAFAEKIEAWEAQKETLHPALFRPPPRFSGVAIPVVPASTYAPFKTPEPLRAPPQPALADRPLPRTRGSLPYVLAALCVCGVLGGGVWYVWQTSGLVRYIFASVVDLGTPKCHPTPALPAPSPGRNSDAFTPSPEFDALIAESQQIALARYPSLDTAGSEMNSRFVFRYKHLLADRSSRLRDPNWPLQLANECAASAGIKPQGLPAPPPGSAYRPRMTPTGALQGPGPAPSPRGR